MNLSQDLGYGLRQLGSKPGFTAVALATLALGIGATTAIFSLVHATLLRPLPFEDPSRLLALHEGVPGLGYPKMGFSPPDLAIFAREQKSFSAIGWFKNEPVNVSGHGQPERVIAARVSSSLFPLLRARPALGRTFTEEEDAPGHNVVLLNYGFWQRRYGGARNVLGQTIEIDRNPYSVIGVMQPNFEFPLRGPEDNGSPADVWVPMAFTPAELEDWGGAYFTSVVGRLRPGIALAQARGEAESLARVIVSNYPPAIAKVFQTEKGLKLDASPLHEDIVGSVRTLLFVLMAAVVFVLLIACANIANLLVSRAATRQQEMAIRTALGATRLRLVRQMLTESLLLALGGGVLGFLLAFWIRDFILTLVPSSIPLPPNASIDGKVLAFATGASFASAILFGLVPALSFSSTEKRLGESTRTATSGRAYHRLQSGFVMLEFASAVVLLTGAGLLLRSFAKLLSTSPGFRSDKVLTLNVPLPRSAYPAAGQIENFYKELLTRISNLPGVQAAGLSNDLPLGAREMVSISVKGTDNSAAGTPQAVCQSWILGDYLQSLGIPLLEGRWFMPEDRIDSQPVAIVSLSTARKFWPGQNAIGKRIRWGLYAPWQIVVGVVGDVNQGPINTPISPHVYRPYNQLSGPLLEEDPFGDWHTMSFAVRTQVEPASLTSAVIHAVHSLDPDLAVSTVRVMTEVIHASFAAPKFNTVLLGALGGLALLLAGLGIYGALAFVVAQQTREIGLRMALGARPGDVLRSILRRGARLAVTGSGLGLTVALGWTRLLKSLLYGVSAIDPITLASVVTLLTVVGLVASLVPAYRAARIDPMVALRYQ